MNQILSYVQEGLQFLNLNQESIVLDENFYPKISGFSCLQNDDNKKHVKFNETSCYMAPEKGESVNYTNKVDVYSYAMILYELFTHKKPFYPKKK